MLTVPGVWGAASYTDDTSPDTSKTKKRNVSIHAQVMPERPLDWFYELVRRYPDIFQEKIKSKPIVQDFNGQPANIKRTVWQGLKEAHIDVTDPLPCQEQVESLAKQVLNKQNFLDELRQRAATGNTKSFILEYTCCRFGGSAARCAVGL